MEPADTLQHLSEYIPRHSHLCELKHQPPDGLANHIRPRPQELGQLVNLENSQLLS